jgi:excisionase family DNA binding protein
MKLISTDDAAKKLGVTGRRIRQLIDEGKLPAQHIGGGYVIDESALEGVKIYGKAGRPPNAKPEASKIVDRPKRTTTKATAKKGGKK